MQNIQYTFDATDFGEDDLNFIMEIARKHTDVSAYWDDEGRWYYIAKHEPTEREIRELKKFNGIDEE
jgi:hypothetical protein